ncbi:DNA photolyase family protein [archaeon]|nr:DNA photolyase family protein [archaeon]
MKKNISFDCLSKIVYEKSIFIFRNDLRTEDNTALNTALCESKQVLPCFIFDSEQAINNRYQNNKALQFMIESLEDLEQQLYSVGGELHYFQGKPEKIVEELITQGFQAVYSNKEYTPASRKQVQKIKTKCESMNASFNEYPDALLNEPEEVCKPDGKSYKMFIPYYGKASQNPVKHPKDLVKGTFYDKQISFETKKWETEREETKVKGGRKEGVKLLVRIEKLKDYEQTKDCPLKQNTNLSAHNKFGTVSIREVYWVTANCHGKKYEINRQIYWRDFFTHIAYHFPRVFEHSFKEEYDNIEWINDPEKFDCWREGRTGIPIVDAGMRELNKTGFIQNRVRMIVASFLVKDFHIDWRLGEQYFAQKLIDYEPSINNGNWQRIASIGADAQPYSQILDPWKQQKNCDPQCEYVKQWIPELKPLEPERIHAIEHYPIKGIGYPWVAIDHKKESENAKRIYSQAGKISSSK